MALGGNPFAFGPGRPALGAFGRGCCGRFIGRAARGGGAGFWAIALNLSAKTGLHVDPAISKQAKKAPNCKRSLTTWFLSSLLHWRQLGEPAIQKARRIWKGRRNSRAPANPESY